MPLEIWIHGQQAGSNNEGTFANPINDITTLRNKITTYSGNDLTITLKAGGRWLGPLPVEHLNYQNVIVRGDPNASIPPIIDGGVVKTDWTEVAQSVVTGKKLWQCTSLPSTFFANSAQEASTVTVGEEVIAGRHYIGTLNDTIVALNLHSISYCWDFTANRMLLLAPTSFTPNTADVRVGIHRVAITNLGNVVTANGYAVRDLSFRRFGTGISLKNCPGVVLENLSCAAVGGIYHPHNNTWDGNFIELVGGCGSAIVQDIYAHGVEDSVIVHELRSTGTQDGGIIRRVTGSHVGRSVVHFGHALKDGCQTSNLSLDNILGFNIRDYNVNNLRMDSVNDGAAVVTHTQSIVGGNGTSYYANTSISRVKSTNSPLVWMRLRGNSAQTYVIQRCTAIYPTTRTLSVFDIGRDQGGTGQSIVTVIANVVSNASQVINLGSNTTSLRVNCYQNTLVNCSTGIVRKGSDSTNVYLQNTLFDRVTRVVDIWDRSGSALTSNGGNFFTSNTSPGFSTLTTDYNRETPGYSVGSYYRPVYTDVYGNGTVLAGTYLDQLGQTFGVGSNSTGAYSVFNTIDTNLLGLERVPTIIPLALTAVRRNYVLGSNDFTAAAWNLNSNTLITNFITPPTGVAVAHTLTNGSSAANVTQSMMIDGSTGNPCTAYVQAMPNTHRWIAIKFGSSDGTQFTWAFFNLQDGIVGTIRSNGATNPSAYMVQQTNGFIRCCITNTVSTANRIVEFYACDSNEGIKTQGHSIYIAGVQADIGNHDHSYKASTNNAIASRTLSSVSVTTNTTFNVGLRTRLYIQLLDNAGGTWEKAGYGTFTTNNSGVVPAYILNLLTDSQGYTYSNTIAASVGNATLTFTAGSVSTNLAVTVGEIIVLVAPFVPVVQVLNSDTVKVSVGNIDPKATRVVVMAATVVGGTVGTYVQVAHRPKQEFPLEITNLIPGTQYRFYAYVHDGSNASSGSVNTIDAITHYLYAETKSVSLSALNVTNANLSVWRSPTNGAIVGESIGAGTGSFGETGVQVGANLRAAIRMPLPRQLNPKVRHGDIISLQISKPPINTRIITDATIVEEKAGLTPVITSDGGGDTASVARPENQTAVTTVVAVEV